MRWRDASILTAAVVLLASACGSGTADDSCPPAPGYTCDIHQPTFHVCITYTGAGIGAPTCSGDEKLVSSCPTAGALGTCLSPFHDEDELGNIVGTWWEAQVLYTEGGMTPESAQQECFKIAGSTWTPN